MNKKITKGDVTFLIMNVHLVENIRESKTAYAVFKNSGKIQKERAAIAHQLNIARGEMPIEEFSTTEEYKTIMAEESDIRLHMLEKFPDVELTAAEMKVLSYFTTGEGDDVDPDLPEGPDVPPKKK